ncbi:MAG: bifunctional riboflavin kinase/FAD synthetase [Fusobacteriaceae bacterium]
MRVIYDIYENRDLIRDSYVAIGSFDGIHRGHKKLIGSAVETAKKNNGKSVVFTFYSHPKEITNSEFTPKLINNLEEKIYLLQKMGVEYLVLQPFNQKFADMEPVEFIDKILKDFLGVKEVFVGFNFGFGKGRSADVKTLESLCRERNIKVREIPPVKVFDKVVSSTGIRDAILRGDLVTVNNFLGEPLLISGIVIHGKKLGRQMGIPTANLERINRSYLPYGIYGGTVTIDGDELDREYNAVINIGRNPTLKPGEKSIEIHILDFSADIYDKKILVRIIKHLRAEKKFSSMEELKNQIHIDIKNWRDFLEKIENFWDGE